MVGISALVGGALAIGGSVLSSSSQNSASHRAAQASQANTDANVGLAREIYGNNQRVLNPFVQRGNLAGNQINALLGLGGGETAGGPATASIYPGQVTPNALSQFMGYPGGAGVPYGIGDTVEGPYSRITAMTNGDMPQTNALAGGEASTMPATMPATTAGPQTAQQAANSAFDIFRNSTGYQFRLGEGLDAVNSAYAGIGGLQSGAAMRGINEYGQNFASNEFGNYMNALGGQQAVGAGAASSLAGVGQNFAGTVINANNYNTQNQMAAQLGRQNVFGNALGTIGGGLLGYGLGR